MFGRIVVGTDGSDTAASAVREAIDIAKLAGATLEIVSAFEPISRERLRRSRARSGVQRIGSETRRPRSRATSSTPSTRERT